MCVIIELMKKSMKYLKRGESRTGWSDAYNLVILSWVES